MTLPVTDFIVQRLLEYDPNFDVGAGVPTTGLMIEPLSIIFQPVIDEVSLLQASQSVLTILESSDPDAFPEDIVDGLASNVFIERNPGGIGSDVIRIRFFEPTEYSAQQGVLVFRGPDSQRYTNSESISVTAAEMALNQEGSLYYIDFPIVALEEGSDFNVSAGSITTMEAEPVGVANVTNLYGVEDGADRETNTELIDRIKVAVTVRALVTGRGIIVALTENFTTIEEIQPIGFGDPEMMRDIVYNVHIGGDVDVYVRTGSYTESSTDIFNLAADTTRQRSGSSSVAALVEGASYDLAHYPLDRTNMDPVVSTIDAAVVYVEGVDYAIDDNSGLLSRIAGSRIYHDDVVGASITSSKVLSAASAFSQVRRGMILTVSQPLSVAGTYTIKNVIDPSTIEIFSEFPGTTFPVTGVEFQVDDLLVVSYEYNPISVDIISAARSTARDAFTITEVPLLYLVSIDKLDSISGDLTGETLSGIGGFGAGGFGAGPFGIGDRPDYILVVDEPTLRYSEREDNFIDFDSTLLGSAVRVTYRWISAIPPIQAYVDDRDNQTQAASLLVRHFVPVLIDGPTIINYDALSNSSPISSDEMTVLVKDFIDNVDEGDALELSDIVDLMYNNGAVRVDLGALEDMRGEIHHVDGTIEFTVPDSAGNITIPDDEIPDPTTRPLSQRIARFIARDITLTRTLI